MKRIVAALTLLAIMLLLAGCSGGDQDTPALTLGDAPWQNGDQLTYDWITTEDGSKVGTSEFTFGEDTEALTITFTDNIGELTQTATVWIDAATLQPRGEEKTIKAPDVEASIITAYTDGKLDIQAVQNGEDRSASIDVPADAIDNDQLLMTLRALPFSEDYEGGRATVVVAQSASVVDTTVRVLNQEQVQVPAGAFNTWKVELNFGQAKQYAWYQTDAPHNLIQYDNGANKMVLTQD